MLDLPEPDPRQLAKAPLEVVVCQLQYDNNLTVADTRTARALHDALGGRGGPYPRVEQIQTQSVSFTFGGGEPASAQSPLIPGWRFTSDDGAWIVSVLPDHLSLETSAYTTWDDFRKRLETVVTATAEQVDPAFEQRLGLRYIDRLPGDAVAQPSDWANLVVPELLGPVLHTGFGSAIRAAQQQLLLALDEAGQTHCGLRHGFVGPPGETPAYILDYDIYREGARSFSVDDALTAADSFHTYALQLFQASVKPEHWEKVA